MYKRDIVRAKQIGKLAIKKSPNSATPYILLGNTLLAAGHNEEAFDLRNDMQKRGLHRRRGISSVMVNGEKHVFGPNDFSHPKSKEIHAFLDIIEQRLITDGYKHDTSWVMQNLSDEKKRHMLCRHSEKMAIAFALLETQNQAEPEIISFLFPL